MTIMKIRYLVFSLCVLAVWGCSSDGDNDGAPTSTFVKSPRPTWAIDWSSNVAMPDWQEPISEDFECSMDLLVTLSPEYRAYSTDNDVMAMFIGDECRALSYRNEMANGNVAYLLHVKGSSDEVDLPMELRFYCEQLHTMNVTNAVPPFTPNNLMGVAYQLELNIGDESTKYPYSTELNIKLPDELPFSVSDDDMLAVFVGNECRAIGGRNPELFEGWRMVVFSKQANESAQIRYYSEEKGGIYTFLKTFTLNDRLQQVNIAF